MTTSSSEVRVSDGPGDIPVVSLINSFGRADISLLGATLINWAPDGCRSVIWLSDKAIFKQGKGIRGGVPICWPWFGAHPEKKDFPQHGFARSTIWQLDESGQQADDAVFASFVLEPEINDWWPFKTRLNYTVTLAECLQLKLTTFNLDQVEITLSQALHTYFNVGDIEKVVVEGLDGKRYLDKPDGFSEQIQKGDISFAGEVDRVYLDTEDTCIINDPSLDRSIQVAKSGSQSTVVWNPWATHAKNMADMNDKGYKTMVCVESTNAASDTRTIKPGDQHELVVSYCLDGKN